MANFEVGDRLRATYAEASYNEAVAIATTPPKPAANKND